MKINLTMFKILNSEYKNIEICYSYKTTIQTQLQKYATTTIKHGYRSMLQQTLIMIQQQQLTKKTTATIINQYKIATIKSTYNQYKTTYNQ